LYKVRRWLAAIADIPLRKLYGGFFFFDNYLGTQVLMRLFDCVG